MSASQYGDKTLGQFIHQARTARGLSLEELGAPELSEHYINALERGAVVPSDMALDVIARNFGVPVSELPVGEAILAAEPDLQAIEEDLHLQLNYVKHLVSQRRMEEALQRIDTVEQGALSYMMNLTWRAQHRIPHLRGIAYLRSGRLSEAQSQIEVAINRVGPDFDAVARVYNLLGVAHYLQGHLQEALEQHEKGLRAAEDGMLRDLTLRLSIYRNLANAHWGLNNFEEAICFYNEALRILEDINDVERQAGIYWGLMMAHRALRDRPKAKLCGLRALAIYEKGTDTSSTASVCHNLAEMNIEDRQYEDAERMLERSKGLLEDGDEQVLLGVLYQDFARLARARGQLDQAAEYAARGVEYGAASCRKIPTHDMQTRGQAFRSYAEDLHVAAQIEEERNNIEAADRLFKEAVATIEQTSFEETKSEIIFSYAEALNRWGAHERATEYYLRGFESRQGTNALHV